MDATAARPSRPFLGGVALLAAAVLMLQVVLTRTFSVTMWYHFAFLSISLAMFGLAAGGVAVYLLPRHLPARPGAGERRAAVAAALFSLTMIAAVAIHLAIPFDPGNRDAGAANPAALGWLYLILALPFFCGGVALTLTLSLYPAQVGRVYFADLLGAGAGCLLAIPALAVFGGPGAVLAVATVAMCAALVLGRAGGWDWRAGLPIAGAGLVLLGLLLTNAQLGFLAIKYAKGRLEQQAVFEGWNAFSRVTVIGDGAPGSGRGLSWALSPAYQGSDPGARLLQIDGDAGTAIVRFDGRLEPLDYLRFDLATLAYHLQAPDAGPVLIIGPGGGRDILAARAFGRLDITAVEINPLIVDTVNDRFGDYSGRPYHLPGVQTVVADARSFLARAPADQRYALIQATLIDTWAASAAGAFVLTESFLYTREAFADYYRHLTDDGLLTVSRWYLPDEPAEALRLMVLASAAWAEMGAADPDRHLVMLRAEDPRVPWQLATLIAKRSPWTAAEVARLTEQADRLGFSVLYAPGRPPRGALSALMQPRSRDRQAFIDAYHLNLSPPSDDSPFFFNVLRPRDFVAVDETVAGFVSPPHMRAARLYVRLLAIVLGLCLLTLIAPLLLARRRRSPVAAARLTGSGRRFLGYAACLGLGFMLIEIALMQRFILFLGQPVYALAVTLLTLLVGGGIGSRLTSAIPVGRLGRGQLLAVAGVVGMVLIYAAALPGLLQALLGLPDAGRVGAGVGLLAPLSLLLGMPFPLGIRLAGERQESPLIPWAWALNGATGVLASVGSVILALAVGFTWVLLAAAAAYGLAFVFAGWTVLRSRWAGQRPDRAAARTVGARAEG